MAVRRVDFNADNLISEYLAGTSIKQLAIDFEFSRQVVYRVLRENNIPIRNRSESMYVRMANTPFEKRQALALAANIAKRGSKNSQEMLHKRALAHKRFIGAFEQEFIDALSNSGINVTPQEPFLSYNLDIGCGNIAVEIHHTKGSPFCSPFIKKLMNCLDAGKSMIYVWISPRNNIVTDVCYQQVISIVKEFSLDPPIKSKYWVIRGTGELYAAGCLHCD